MSYMDIQTIFLSEGRSMWWLSYSAYRKWKNYFQTSIISHGSVDVSVSKRILRKCVSAFASDTVGYFIHCLFIYSQKLCMHVTNRINGDTTLCTSLKPWMYDGNHAM